MADAFFDEPVDQSLLKAEMVVEYFVPWARIISKRAQRIGYFDLYAGPGRYGTGQKSTPLRILEKAIAEPDLASRLVTVFNDANPNYTESLQAEIDSMPGIDKLKYSPQILTGDVDDLVQKFAEIRTIPAISFIDPWGYKGLSLELLHAVMKDWGSEVVFFFNYNRINMGINNPVVRHHMQALFGEERLATLRNQVDTLMPVEREEAIHKAIEDALDEMGARYLIPFKFRRADGRLSHSICFVSKHRLGYDIMKGIMAKRGLVDEDGVPRFEHIPASAGAKLPLGRERPILQLANDLMRSFAGQKSSVETIFSQHNVGTTFIMPNYKDVIIQLEQAGRVTCDPDINSRRKGTCADHVVVTFPP